MTDNALYTLWLILSGKVGSPRTHRLICAMSAKEAYHATRAELISRIGEKDAAYFLDKDLSQAQTILDDCREKGIDVICYHDEDYPASLREIDDPPAALFCLGQMPSQELPTVGIVGTRKCSSAAAGIAASFSCSLALSGFQIVSGMANGIDTYAHKGSLVKGNPSFAVLGCGVDVIYPKKNATLYEILKEHGGLISEYLPGTPPMAANFPRRNRIISGLSDGVLVVECPPKSGSMITARFAVEQNRTLFAIPSAPADRVNTGTNQLIKHGAIFCTEPNDIFNEFLPRFSDRIHPTTVNFQPIETPQPEPTSKEKKGRKKKSVTTGADQPNSPPKMAPNPSLSAEETIVYRAFDQSQVLSADDLCQTTGIAFHRLLPLLQALELSGCIESLPGALFRRK